jgi:hypothetical protein
LCAQQHTNTTAPAKKNTISKDDTASWNLNKDICYTASSGSRVSSAGTPVPKTLPTVSPGFLSHPEPPKPHPPTDRPGLRTPDPTHWQNKRLGDSPKNMKERFLGLEATGGTPHATQSVTLHITYTWQCHTSHLRHTRWGLGLIRLRSSLGSSQLAAASVECCHT